MCVILIRYNLSGMPGYVVVQNIRSVIHYFGMITQFKAYFEISSSSSLLRSELQSSGVSLTDCPHNGHKDASDKMIMVDMITFALDTTPPATVVLISGDRDFVYAVSVLRMRRYNVVLVVPNRGAAMILKSQANVVLDWRYDVLKLDAWTGLNRVINSNPTNINYTSSFIGASASPANIIGSPPPLTQDAREIEVQNDKEDKATLDESRLGRYRMAAAGKAQLKDSKDAKKAPESTREPVNEHCDTDRPIVAAKEVDDDLGFCFSPTAPGFFDLLIEVLEKSRIQGEDRPRRSKVGSELKFVTAASAQCPFNCLASEILCCTIAQSAPALKVTWHFVV